MNQNIFLLSVNRSTCWKEELHLTNSESYTICFLLNFIGFTTELISSGYQSLVQGINRIFMTLWGCLTSHWDVMCFMRHLCWCPFPVPFLC